MRKISSLGKTTNSLISKSFTSLGNSDAKINKVNTYKISKQEVDQMINDIYRKKTSNYDLREQIEKYKKTLR